MDEVEKLLQEVDLLNSDDEDDGNYGVDCDDRIKSVQKAFLRGEDEVAMYDESNELLKQVQDQVTVEKKYAHLDKQRDLDLEQRYLAFKQDRPLFSTATPSSSPASSSTSPLTATTTGAKLPGPPPKPIQDDEFHDEMDDWCVICNEDATIECKGCENDRFCDRCFYDGHKSELADYEAMKHKWRRITT
ncbi:hypothetical protein BDB00DRAFT_841375 [Zychaea mexicana]|uniref:uncharacterized protein n=1 Tax=Zychaea mexicana TaxID=64656 RepID=UPI0022FE01E5|nr:uncharacterized protein BDB00DRAFT_841375 [Zychaea mexicana]KAI9489782.1 hypothetical protein BDB00DRAFT_841375 [Zychaea mexicana]